MSVRTMARVWEGSRHASTPLLMLLAIADFADDDGRAYPSVGTLATKCRTSPRQAIRILAELEESGELQVLKNKGPRGTNVYRVALEALTSATPLTRVSPLTPKAAGGDIQGKEPLTRVSPEPSVNHQEPKRVRAKRAARSTVARAIPNDFRVSDPVRKWAATKGFDRLEDHLEAFIGKCKAKAYRYADWDSAFMEAIRKDWAGLRQSAGQRRSEAATHTGFDGKDYAAGDIPDAIR